MGEQGLGFLYARKDRLDGYYQQALQWRMALAAGEQSPADIAGALRALQADAPERKVQVEIAPGLQAEADPELAQVLLDNLLGNAWKFTRTVADSYKPARAPSCPTRAEGAMPQASM